MTGPGISPLIAPCVLHRTHSPRPWIDDMHHVVLESWTKALGLPESRLVSLCPTGHVNVHAAVRDRIAARPYKFSITGPMRLLVDEAMAFYDAHKAALAGHGISGLEFV